MAQSSFWCTGVDHAVLCHSCEQACGVSRPRYYWHFRPNHSLVGEGSCSAHCGICVLCPLDASSTPSPIFVIAWSASSRQTSLKGTTALNENHGGEVTVTSSVPQARTPRAILESLPPLKSLVTGWFSQVPQLPQESASCLTGCSPQTICLGWPYRSRGHLPAPTSTPGVSDVAPQMGGEFSHSLAGWAMILPLPQCGSWDPEYLAYCVPWGHRCRKAKWYSEVEEWLPPVCFQLQGRRTSKRSNCLSGDGIELHLIRRKALGRLAQSTQSSVPGSPEFQTMPIPYSPHTPAHTFPTPDILSFIQAGLASLRL